MGNISNTLCQILPALERFVIVIQLIQVPKRSHIKENGFCKFKKQQTYINTCMLNNHIISHASQFLQQISK